MPNEQHFVILTESLRECFDGVNTETGADFLARLWRDAERLTDNIGGLLGAYQRAGVEAIRRDAQSLHYLRSLLGVGDAFVGQFTFRIGDAIDWFFRECMTHKI